MAHERIPSLMHRTGAAIILAVLLACATALPAAAQDCFRGRPLPTCAAFPLTEVGFSLGTARQDESPRGASSTHLLTWDLGWMKNLNRETAVGASAFLEGEGFRMGRWRAGAKAHYRRWLGPHTSLDVAPGVFLAGDEPFQPSLSRLSGLRGTVLTVGYNSGDLVSLTVQIEAVQNTNGDLSPTLYAGVRFGSFAGALAAVFAAVVSLFNVPPVSSGF